MRSATVVVAVLISVALFSGCAGTTDENSAAGPTPSAPSKADAAKADAAEADAAKRGATRAGRTTINRGLDADDPQQDATTTSVRAPDPGPVTATDVAQPSNEMAANPKASIPQISPPARTTGPPAPAPGPAPTTAPGNPPAAPATTTAPSVPTSAAPTPAPTGHQSGGWLVTVYYTPRESNYPGAATAVSGCPTTWCTNGYQESLGAYSNDFIERMKVQGAGLLTSGPFAGQYLMWSPSFPGSGYWISSTPLSANGETLVRLNSVAASTNDLEFNDRFTIADCGRDPYGGSINQSVCAEFKSASWRVVDRFHAGSSGQANHLDLYIGLEAAGERFEASRYYLSWSDVVISVQ